VPIASPYASGLSCLGIHEIKPARWERFSALHDWESVGLPGVADWIRSAKDVPLHRSLIAWGGVAAAHTHCGAVLVGIWKHGSWIYCKVFC
jgi:hypothetical protein